MSASSNKNKKKPVAGSFIPYETGYVNIAGDTFFLSMGPTEPGAFELTDDSLKTDAAFDLLFLGGSSGTFTDTEKATLQRVIRAIFGVGKSMTKKGLRLPCSKEEGELLVRSLLYRRSLLMDEIASYDELSIEDVHARYLRDHLDRLNKLIDEDVPQTVAPCKDTALVDPNKPAKVVGLDDDRMLRLLEIFAYLLAQGYDPVEVLGKKLPIPADILTRMAQPKAPLLRDYESEFERERGAGKRPPYTRTLIKIKKVLEDDEGLLAAIAPEEALGVIRDIEDKLKINPKHTGTIKERRDGIIGEIDRLQKALAAAEAEIQRLQAEKERLEQELVKASQRIKELEAEIVKKDAQIAQLQKDLAAEKAISADLRKQLDAAKAEIAQLKKDLAAAQAEVARLTAELAKAQAEITRLNVVITGLEAQITQLKADLAAAQEQIRTLEAEVQRLTNELQITKIKYIELNNKYNLLERELNETKRILAAAVEEIAYWMKIRDEYEALLRELPDTDGSTPDNTIFNLMIYAIRICDEYERLVQDLLKYIDELNKEILFWVQISNEYERLVQDLLKYIDDLNQEILFWVQISDEYTKLVDDMIKEIEDLEHINVTLMSYLHKYARLVDEYGNALEEVITENEQLRQQVADLTQDKAYILQLLTYIWDSLGAFIERMRGQGLIVPGEYPALDNGDLDTLHTSTETLGQFLEAVQMPPVPAVQNMNSTILCMLNTLYFILISQMNAAVEPILLEIYRLLQPDERDFVVKFFFKLVFAIRKNLLRLPNSIEGSMDRIEGITARLQQPILNLFTYQDSVHSTFENFVDDPRFFNKIYTNGNQRQQDSKQNTTFMAYIFFLSVLAGTLDENKAALREFGCSMEGDLGEVVPPPGPDTFTLTLATEPAGQGILEGAGNINTGIAQPISWNANGAEYTFDHWEPRESVETPDSAQTMAKPITKDTAIIAHLTESAPPPPPPPPPPVTTEQLCATYKELFYRFDGEPQHEPRFLDRQEAFRAQFSPEQFALIERMCHPVEKQYARVHGPEVLGPQAFPSGTSASAIGSPTRAGIPRQALPSGLSAISRRRGGSLKRKAKLRRRTYKRRTL